MSRGVAITEVELNKHVEESIAKAYQAGLSNQNWREHLLSDPQLISELSYLWWFGMTSKERKLDPTCKPKRL